MRRHLYPSDNVSLASIRREELNLLSHFFGTGVRVLELGGGDGYQAKMISDLGCAVESIDIQIPQTATHYPVRQYDGVNIPFEADRFDVVYSSSVLQYAQDLPALLHETKRVLTYGGKAIHILPSPSCRIWTSLAQLPYSAQKLIQRTYSPGFALRQAISIKPQGRFRNSIVEVYYFGIVHWSSVFAKAGFRLKSVSGNGIFYTGQMMGNISMPTRKTLAKLLGSASNTYLLEKANANCQE